MNNKFRYKSRNIKFGFGTSLLKAILEARGISKVDEFLNLNESVIEDVNLYDNISLGGEMILEHLTNNSNIKILCDSDLDGFTSSSVMYMELEDIAKHLNVELDCDMLIHHKKKQHGLTPEIMKDIKENPCDLLIVPDAGTEDYIQHEVLFDMGIDVVILDHHPIDLGYSNFACVINNQLSDKVKNKAITGVGVVYKMCKWFDERLNMNNADSFLDLFAVGNIADSGDMRDFETRFLTLKGLSQIEKGQGRNKLIRELFAKKTYSLKGKATIDGFAFYMSPSINSFIRGATRDDLSILSKAMCNIDDTIVHKIRGKGEVEISIQEYVIRQCDSFKRTQDKEVDKWVNTLSKQIEDFGLNHMEIMVVNAGEVTDNDYNRVIVNKLSSKYNKHCLLLKPMNEFILGGSCSGRRNRQITDLKHWCKDTNLFTKVGGHPMAFNAQIPSANINMLYEAIGTLPSDDIMTYLVDMEFTDKSLNKDLVVMIGGYNHLFGNKLDKPSFAVKDLIVNTTDIKLSEKKTTIMFTWNGIDFIMFKTTEDMYNDMMKYKTIRFEIIGSFNVNSYGGETKPQIVIDDIFYEESKPKAFRF